MAMSSTTANWHWKTKGCTSWAREWFERELPTLSIDGEENKVVKIQKVVEVEGDCEIGQRKSKLIAIYDLKIELEWTSTTADGTEVKGKLVIPEVSHEITLDQLSDYTYNWTLTTPSSKEVDALFKLAKARLPTALETKFAEFPTVLIDTHGRDLQVLVSSEVPTPTGSPAPPATAAVVNNAPVAPAPVPQQAAKAINTSTVTVEASFMASADDLFGLLTDQGRIPHWSRAPAESTPQEGGSFSLFGGGVNGTYISLSPPTQFVQKWALRSPRWPDGHFATLTTSLEQSSDSTTMKLALNGVPKGMEEEIEHNLQGYYIRGLKSIGLGTVL